MTITEKIKKVRDFIRIATCFVLLASAPRLAAAGEAHQFDEVGEAQVWILDYHDHAQEQIELRRKDGSSVLLEFSGKRPPVRTGDKISVKGFKKTDSEAVLVFENGLTVTQPAPQMVLAGALSGSRSVLLVRVRSSDEPAPKCSAAYLASRMWTGELSNPGGTSVRGLYEVNSSGAFSFISDRDQDGSPDVVEVSLGYATANQCNETKWASDANSILKARGISVSSWNHVVYELPSNISCGWAGRAAWPGSIVWINGVYCDLPDALAHELGHNLGLNHAATDPNNNNRIGEEYGDYSCPMAYAGVGWRYFNSAHKAQLGWIPGSKIVSNPRGDITLSAIERNPGQDTNPQAILLPRSSEQYYLSYREVLDSYSSSGYASRYAGRTSIHHAPSAMGYSYFVTALSDGQSFTDPTNKITVTQISHGSGQARIRITDPSLIISASSPPDGFIDPLEDKDASLVCSANDKSGCRGLGGISITFSEPVVSVGGGPISASNFEAKYFRNGAEVSAGTADLALQQAPIITLASGSGAGPYTLHFNPRIPLGAWTRIEAVNVTTTSGTAISTLNGQNRRTFAFLPMDLTQDGKVLGDDINRWLQIFNSSYDPTPLGSLQFCDQKRNGIVAGEDITRAIQLINGTSGATFRAWSGFDLGSRP